MSSQKKFKILLHSLFFTLFSNLGHAQVIGYALPNHPIKIDGNLDDWSKKHPSYCMDLTYGNNPPADKKDVSASFMVAYSIDHQSLYFAVEVIDDSHVVDSSGNANWASLDNHIIYIDLVHSKNRSGVLSYLYSDDYKTIFSKEDSWDPHVRDSDWESVTVAFSRNNLTQTTIYEWALHLGGHIRPNKTIGIDHMIIDKDPGDDPNDITILSWGEGDPKHLMSGFLGDIVLLDPSNETTSVCGQLRWKRDPTLESSQKIRIQSKDYKDLWVETSTTDTGIFSVEMPVGNYYVSLAEPYLDLPNFTGLRVDDHHEIFIDSTKLSSTFSNILEVKPLQLPSKKYQEGWLFNFAQTHQKSVDQIIQLLMDHYAVPGVSLSIINGDSILYHKNYGYKNAYTRERVDDSTLFEAASITKPVFASAVVKLAEQGILDLDRPLHNYLPMEGMQDDRYKKMTARHVLSHRSGLPNFGQRIISTPGLEYGYSGEGINYLSQVVEHITNKEIEHIISDEILIPFGIQNIYFKNDKYVSKNASFGHRTHSPTLLTIPASPNMAFSMLTDAKSFSQFAIKLFQEKKEASKYGQLFFTKETVIPADKSTGLGDKEYFGLGIHQIESSQGHIFGHGGNNGDFQCQFEVYVDQNIGFIIFTNSDNGMKLINSFRDYCILGQG